MAKPQIVIIPGAWHAPLHMATVISKLESHGYKVHTRQLPAVGNPNPPKDLSEDIAAVRSLVEGTIGEGDDVIVVPHSWAGIVAGSALVGLGKKEREAEGKKGGVTRAGYMAAFILPEGVSLVDTIPGTEIPEWWNLQEPHIYATEPGIFYNDLPESEQKHWHSKLQSQSFATFHAKATAASWKQIPTSYLLCEDDRGVPAQAQEAMTNGVKEAGGDIEVTRFKSSHSPFLSMPDETVDWIRKVAGEKL